VSTIVRTDRSTAKPADQGRLETISEDSLQASQHAWSWYIVPALLAVLGCAALMIDIPVARWSAAHKFPSTLKKVCDLMEIFGQGAGVALILLTVWTLAVNQRKQLPRIIFCAYFAGLAADAMKLLLARGRPYKTELASIHSVWNTFQGWLPGFSSTSASQSFISAHTATAVGLALGLSWLMPRGKWLFYGFAVLVALQRIAGPYHFVSDTLWGAAIGWLVASAFLPGGWLSRPLDRFERQIPSGVSSD
jgi:membrane-associated phospholipid phosphatase